MPVSGMGIDEGPFHAIPGKAVSDRLVFKNVFRIVEFNEIEMPHWPKDGECPENQDKTKKHRSAHVVNSAHNKASGNECVSAFFRAGVVPVWWR
jgi:hypothetical protein